MKTVPAIFLIIFFIPIYPVAIIAQADRTLNEQAIREYNEGKYDEALKIWYVLLEKGNSDPDLFYNIGNAEAMKGNIPNSILHYERALRYKPGNKDFKIAIDQMRGQIKNATIPVNSFFLTEWIRIFLAFLRPGYWALCGMIFLLAGVFFWLRSIRFNEKVSLKYKFNSRVLFSVGIVIVLIAIGSYCQMYRKGEAIIFTECDFREAPAQESPLTRSLQPGEKVTILDELSGWFKVNLANLDEGWIKEDCFIRI